MGIMHAMNRILGAWVMATCSGCTSSIQLTLRADVSDGATGEAHLHYKSGGVGWSRLGCFSGGVCEMELGPESVHGAHDVKLVAWADPENDDENDPESDEPAAETILDVPEMGVLDVTLDLE